MIDLEPTGAAVGAFVAGVQLADVGSAEAAEIVAALGEHGVLFFRDQELSPEGHLSFARAIGSIDVNAFFAHNDEHPEIAEVRTRPDNTTVIGGAWHTDHSYDVEPALGSVLVARQLPSGGGDTAFSSMYAAFDALSPGLQSTLLGMKAVHSSHQAFGIGLRQLPESEREGRFNAEFESKPDVVHPAVIRHPISGRPALYVNRSFTTRFDGWTAAESKPLLDYLFDHGAQVEFTYRFRWEPGSVALWDNRCTWHKALNDYQGESRLMHRITLSGCALAAA